MPLEFDNPENTRHGETLYKDTCRQPGAFLHREKTASIVELSDFDKSLREVAEMRYGEQSEYS